MYDTLKSWINSVKKSDIKHPFLGYILKILKKIKKINSLKDVVLGGIYTNISSSSCGKSYALVTFVFCEGDIVFLFRENGIILWRSHLFPYPKEPRGNVAMGCFDISDKKFPDDFYFAVKRLDKR